MKSRKLAGETNPMAKQGKRLVCAATSQTKPCPKRLNVVPLVIHITDEKGEAHDVALRHHS